eukprot:982175-Amphidinium_carterae.1
MEQSRPWEGKTRCREETIRLVKVKGTQHPPDVGTKHLSKQGMLHAKSMLGLMEPEALAPYGYEVPDS